MEGVTGTKRREDQAVCVRALPCLMSLWRRFNTTVGGRRDDEKITLTQSVDGNVLVFCLHCLFPSYTLCLPCGFPSSVLWLLTDGLLLSQSRQRIVCLNSLKANVQVGCQEPLCLFSSRCCVASFGSEAHTWGLLIPRQPPSTSQLP